MSDTIPERVTRLEALAEHTHEALLRIERRMEDGFRELRGEMSELRADMRSDFRWLLGVYLGGMGAIIGGGGYLLIRIAAKVGGL